ncbi:MAG: PAS domain S-box protein [Methanobacterium sp.]|uniref:PAS domain S-box protein n=1 Tax=Methanobacterium sp. TaxID=2164 RepID=UPI003D64E420|nr:PAS domain S-box protein [Methanobacterium sp.]
MKDSGDEEDLSNELNLLKQKIIELEKQVTEKEFQLEKSKRITQLLDSATDSVFLHDFDGNFVYLNEAAYKTRGYTKEELMNMNLHKLDAPKYEKLIDPRIKDLMEKGESIFESATICKDGSQMPVEVHSTIIEYENKPLVLSYVRDITERKKIENELISVKEQYRALFDNMGVGIAFIAPNMEILDLNGQMKEWFPNINVSKKPICYKAFNDPPREDICTYCPTYKTLKDGKIHESTTDTPVGDEIINYRVVSSPIMDEGGKVVAAIEMVEDITERKRMEEDLKRAYATFNSIFEGPENIIAFSLDNKYNYIFFNQAHSQTMKNIWGVDIEIGKNMLDYISFPEDRMKAKINYDRALSGENFIELEAYGEETLSRRYWENIYNPIQSGKSIIGLTVFCIDITERKKAEDALRKSEEKFRAIFENVQDIFFQTDIKGKIIEVSPSVENYFGIGPNELVGNQVDMLYHNPEDRKKLLNALNEKGEVTDYEITLKNSENRLIYISANVHFIFDSKNRPVGIEGALRDITERKKTEEALKLSQIRLSDAMDLAHLANWELDPYKQIFIFNDKYYSMLGTTAEDEGGYLMPVEHYIKKYVHPNDAQFIAEGMKKSLATRKLTFGAEFEHRMIRRDGEICYVAIHIKVIPSTDTQSAHIYGTVQDITDRKIVEEKLRESLEEKEMLLKEIHHRVKNNLMVISSLLNLQSQYIKDKEALDIFKESQNRAKSMALIHERLYRSTDLKKIDFGEYIHTLATDLFHTYVPDPGRVKLNMNAENLMVDINTTVPLGLIVNELITNSMKHAFPEGRKGEINVDFFKEGNEFVLIVQDNGIGFPEDLDFRNTKSLGLQLVNNLIGQIGGTFGLERSNGTKFKIKFKEKYE